MNITCQKLTVILGTAIELSKRTVKRLNRLILGVSIIKCQIPRHVYTAVSSIGRKVASQVIKEGSIPSIASKVLTRKGWYQNNDWLLTESELVIAVDEYICQ